MGCVHARVKLQESGENRPGSVRFVSVDGAGFSSMPRRPRGPARVGSDLRPPPDTWLERYRREQGFIQSQNDFADAAGISPRHLSRLEHGDMKSPPLGYLVNAAAILAMDWLELIEDDWTEFRPLKDGAPSEPRRPLSSPYVH